MARNEETDQEIRREITKWGVERERQKDADWDCGL